MTDEEYKMLASKTMKELDELDDFVYEDFTITNIGEFFIERIRYGLSTLNEPTPKNEIVKEANSINNDTQASNELEDSIYAPPVQPKTTMFITSSLIKGFNHAIHKWDNIEDVLSSLGMDNPQTFISAAKATYKIKDADKRFEEECSLINELLSVPNSTLAYDFLQYAIFESYRTYIIDTCKRTSRQTLIAILKYIGDKYYTLYQERIRFFIYLNKKINKDINRLFNYLDENGLTALMDKYISSKTFDEFMNKIEKGETICFNEDMDAFVLDICFVIYHFVYQRSQYLVRLAFFFMSDKMSAQIQEVIYNSFSSCGNNSLVQYEYAWWCKETGQTLNIPFPFSTEPFDKKKTTIEDYDLDKLKYGPNMLVNAPEPIKDIEYHEPDDYVTGQTTSVHVGEKQILDNLEPFIIKYVPAKERFINGKKSITDYMEDIIALSKTIKDSYNAYGFAYILFHSRFLKWNEMPFNIQFVETIISMFDIHIPENKMKDGHILNYEHKDAKRCAKKLLTPRESLRHFLNRETLKAIDW